MREIVRKVDLLKPFDVEKVAIERDRYFPNAYIIDLPLDSVPDHVWQDIFLGQWRSSRHLWDRKLFVIGNKLRLVTTSSDFGEKLDWVERVIKDTNKAIDEYNLAIQKKEEMRVEDELEKGKVWDEKARIEMIKGVLREKYV